MEMHLEAWERDYRARGRLWGGVARLPELAAGSRVLELGCGNGKTLSAFCGLGLEVVAVDISRKAVALCRLRAPQAGLVLGDARYLPFREESFDAVLAFHVAGHLLRNERELLACEAERALSRGGRLLLREFEAGDMRAGQGREVEPGTFQRGQGTVTHYFSEDELEELFSGLEASSVETNEWMMHVRGRDMVRRQLEAVFLKP
jgi:SAM-dependent methyltransferase